MVAAVETTLSLPLIVPVTPNIVIPERILVAISFACSPLSIPTLPPPSWYPCYIVIAPETLVILLV